MASPSSANPARAHIGAHRPRVKRRYEVGSSAMVYVGITLLIALGAFNSQNNLLFWTFGLAMSALLVSGMISGAMLMGVEVIRESIGDARVGEPVRIRYRVRNHNRMIPVFALSIEEAGFQLPSRPSFIGRVLVSLVRFVFPMLRNSQSLAAPIGVPHAFVAHVGAGETLHVESVTLAQHRGPAALTAILAHSSFPFGLMRKILRFPQPGATVVLPAIIEAPSGTLGSTTASGLSGAVSRRPGPGEEFFSLREYVPGDGFRSIAWMASARRGSLLVRQNAAPSPGRLWIVLRLRPKPDSDTDDERAISLAAGIAARAEDRGMEYGLVAPLTRTLIQPRRGPGHLGRLMTELGMLDLGPDDGRGSLSAFPAQAIAARGLCIVVHSRAVDPAFRPAAAPEDVIHVSAAETVTHAPREQMGAAA